MPSSFSSEFQDLRATIEAQIELFGNTLPGVSESEYREESDEQRKTSEQSTEPVGGSAAEPEPAVPEEAESQPAEPRRAVSASASAAAHESPPEPEPATVPDASTQAEPTPYDRIAELIPEDSPLRAFDTLDEVSNWVAHTVLIPLDESRTNPVFGVGNPQADLMVIGEAPGRNEDLQGEPFVGRAGKLLDDILAAIDFDREKNAYIANILKSRPPNNRNPEASEVIAHLPILHKQIALIRPKVILCVGKTAGTSLLNLDSTLGAMRGTFHDYHGLPVLVTYHPAALLRNSNWKRPTWEDVKLLRRRYEELTGAPSGAMSGATSSDPSDTSTDG